MESLVSASAAGLGDDPLHVLDLSLATAEGTELCREKRYVSRWFWFVKSWRGMWRWFKLLACLLGCSMVLSLVFCLLRWFELSSPDGIHDRLVMDGLSNDCVLFSET